MKLIKTVSFFASTILALSGCGGLGNGSTMISGTVTGLAEGTSVVLENNNTEPTTVSANGSFFFKGQVDGGGSYSVTVSSQPVGQTCTVTNGSGVVGAYSSDVSNIVVTCSGLNGVVFGYVTGLAAGGTLELENTSKNYYQTITDTLSITANGAFAFPTLVKLGYSYDVTITTQPSGQTCVVTDATGAIPAKGGITPVNISCS